MRGRQTPSDEVESAANTIGAYFRDLGLLPAFPFASYTMRYATRAWGTTPAGTAPNAGAVLEGSDPTLKSQYVVVIAHMDGKGVGVPVNGDSIYNGADDNASGTAAVLEMAEEFAGTDPHPRRSVLFLVVSGEEHGLWGTYAYLANPTVPVANIVAVLNFDMISRNSPDSVFGSGMDGSTLGDRLLEVVAAHPEEPMVFTPGPTGGSDQVPFWERGVPFVMFFAGLNPDYHTPVDEVGRIDATKAARVTRMAFYLALRIAGDDARPAWKPGWPAPPAPGSAVH
jgi:Zn-dependent M28 family amino/carboxypeptidase